MEKESFCLDWRAYCPRIRGALCFSELTGRGDYNLECMTKKAKAKEDGTVKGAPQQQS